MRHIRSTVPLNKYHLSQACTGNCFWTMPLVCDGRVTFPCQAVGQADNAATTLAGNSAHHFGQLYKSMQKRSQGGHFQQCGWLLRLGRKVLILKHGIESQPEISWSLPDFTKERKNVGMELDVRGKKSVTRRQNIGQGGKLGNVDQFCFGGSECKMMRTGRKAGIFALKKNQ